MFYNGSGDYMDRQILHIDVNNAFLSWTAVDMLSKGETIDIREIPAVIGGDEAQRKGVVLAKSMKAKQFGIVTGETLYSARKKCPNIKVYMGNHSMYKVYSDKLYNLLLEYTDIIERFSIDECFLDLTHYLRGQKLIDVANEISKRVKEELKFTVNIGVANNKLLAKMASDFTKPDRVHTLYKEEIKTKMWVLPVSDLFMVGRKSIPKLERMGIKTIGDLANRDINLLIKQFGKHGKMMWEYANGIDNSEVIYQYTEPKCVGNSITFPHDIDNIEKLDEILLSLTEQVTYRLRKHKLLANVVNVHIKTNEFKVSSHQRKLDVSTSSTKIIYGIAKELLGQLYKGEYIRLLGVQVSELCRTDEAQISLFDTDINKKQDKIDKTLDEIKKKYGYEKITRAGKLNADKMFK